jgi:DNA uptake protein ComE-like DNA-binding protein
MSIRSDHKALLFLSAIAALGAAVRMARAFGGAVSTQQPALDHQLQAADSAKRSLAAKRPEKGGRSSSRARGGAVVAGGASPRDYRGRLDLDLATAAEIDSVPGIGPTLAKRIVADRMANGAFRELVALRRVKGLPLKLLSHLDSLVSFSGVYKPPQASDTVMTAKQSKKKR